MNFYDFEVFRYDWLVVIINPVTKKETVIINDVPKLQHYYERHKNDIWIGYNSRHYDQYILKALLCGFDAWAMNDWLVNEGGAGWQFSSLLNKIFLINYDVAPLNKSLKQLEGFQGHSIHESSVDFKIKRKLTDAEIAETIEYCRNDVLETINVFTELIDDFNAQMGLVKMFDLPLSAMAKTKAQISAEILECVRTERNDEWDLFALDCIELSNTKRWLTVKKKKKKGDEESKDDKTIGKVFCTPKEWFLNPKYQDYRYYFEMEVAGVPHQFGWGGIHGAKKKYHYECKDGYIMLHIDVESYYPRLMIWHNLLTRSAKRPERFKMIFDTRMKLKHEDKKKEQAPLKIVINGTFGICKDKNNAAYDPRNANLICINGQLMLLDLIEHLEAIPSFELIQSNTDGLIIKIHERDFDLCDDICYEWESRCDMILAFEFLDSIAQKDVNNYVFHFEDTPENGGKRNKIERKGAYVKELSGIDNDLPIINKAINDMILKGIDPEETINNCNELIQFQKICKLTNKFDYVKHNNRIYTNKCYRIFASRRESDGTVYKYKENRPNKFGNTSMHSFIENGDVTSAKVPSKLDKQWYVNLAKERLKQYGIN